MNNAITKKNKSGGNGQNISKKQKPKSKTSGLATIKIVSQPRSIRRIGTTVDEARYRACLRDPFSVAANGAQVPDLFPFPLATYKAKFTNFVKTGTDGGVDFMLTPHPLLMAWIFAGAADFDTPLRNYSTTPKAKAIPKDALINKFSCYRVVGYGAKIKLTQQPLNVQGKLLVACVPATGDRALNWRLFESFLVDDTVGSQTLGGVQLSNGGVDIPDTILELPDSMEIALAHLINNDLELVYRPLNQSAFFFQPTMAHGTTGAVGGSGVGDVVTWDTALGDITQDAVTSGAHLPIDLQGMPIWYVKVMGATSVTTVLEIEMVLHLEGTPSISATSDAVELVADAPQAVYGFDALARVLRDAYRDPFIRTVAVQAAQSVVSTNFGLRLLGNG
jgi:hypothetical protein